MILLTGGAGFIGSIVLQELNRRGFEDVVIVDRLRDTSKWKNLRGQKFSYFVTPEEFFDRYLLDYSTSPKAIIHLGACSTTTQTDMDYLYKNNVDFSMKLFQYAKDFQLPFLYASSAATYGEGEFGYIDSFEVSKKLKPLNRYGYSKLLFDDFMMKEGHALGHWFGLKFFNVYGPNEDHKGGQRSLVHKAYEQILESGTVQLFKSYRNEFQDGEQLRDFVYVKDVARAIVDLLCLTKNTKKFSGLLNLGTGKAQSFNNLVKCTFESLGKKVNIHYIEMPENLRHQYQYFTQADMAKFFQILPKFQFTPMNDAVNDYVKNHLM